MTLHEVARHGHPVGFFFSFWLNNFSYSFYITVGLAILLPPEVEVFASSIFATALYLCFSCHIICTLIRTSGETLHKLYWSRAWFT
ncbi:hypothetical protein K445DRAFT_250483 [Daldinia sp. EC12]|nr:hypothetical protein K445DRAFT_250483 [Daldinia sp. EC12]